MMPTESVITLLLLMFMVWALIRDKMRPGLILFTVVILMLCCGILTPKECLEGFSNKGMITVALLFLVSEGVRQSGMLERIIHKMMPKEGCSLTIASLRIFPMVSFISAFLNNTPVVVIFAPMVRTWANKVGLSASKLLIPLSYATILGGICTLIGTSTNLVVDGLMLDSGMEGLSMFELSKVGVFVCLGGLAYLISVSRYLLPETTNKEVDEENKRDEFDDTNLSRRKRWLALILLVFMVLGATVGELPLVREAVPNFRFDMFFFAAITCIIMAWTGMFRTRRYSRYISWDILITIACAFGISKGMMNSGFADFLASYVIEMSQKVAMNHGGIYMMLVVLYAITNVFTELITNNAAAALGFPLALSVANQLGVDPMPFCVCIAVAASAAFSTPIGYQTNLIVQSEGGYRFTDFMRVGLPLNFIVFVITVLLIPLVYDI